MKKHLISALLCLALFLVAAPEAHALVDGGGYGYIYANQEMYEFWQNHRDELWKKYNISPIGTQEFHDGLLLVWGNGSDMYINRNAEPVDLNQGRFDSMHAFSDGLAAVTKGNYYGYINTQGTLVIPIQFRGLVVDHYIPTGAGPGKWLYNHGTQIGKFIGDTALIMGSYNEDWPYKGLDSRNFGSLGTWLHFFAGAPVGLDYAYIAKDGKLVGSVETIYDEQEALRFLQGRTSGRGGGGITLVEQIPQPPNPVVPYVEYKGPEGLEIAKPEIPELLPDTYGQASFKARGYTIENNVGYLLVDVTNKGKAKDQGDLFYVLYKKYKKAEGMISNTKDFLPSDYILQIHYEVGANETKTLRVPVSSVSDWDLTDENRDGGWYESDMVADSRFVLAQAESETECAELVTFFKAAHDYGETSLDYVSDNGVTVLAKPYSSTQRVNYLNQKLSSFTRQF